MSFFVCLLFTFSACGFHGAKLLYHTVGINGNYALSVSGETPYCHRAKSLCIGSDSEELTMKEGLKSPVFFPFVIARIGRADSSVYRCITNQSQYNQNKKL